MDQGNLLPLWYLHHSNPSTRLQSVAPHRVPKLPFVTKQANVFLRAQWERFGFALQPHRVATIKIQKETHESTRTAGHIWVTSARLMKRGVSIFSIGLLTPF